MKLEQQPGIERADAQPVVDAERRPKVIGIAAVGPVVPFEQAERRRAGESVLEVEPHAETGMEIDQIRREALVREARGRPIHRLTEQDRALQGLDVVVGCGRGFPARAHPQPAHSRDLAVPRDVDEEDLVAGIGRQRSGQMREMPRKMAMGKNDPHWLGWRNVPFAGAAIAVCSIFLGHLL